MLYTGKEDLRTILLSIFDEASQRRRQKSNCTKREPLPCDQVTNTQVDVLITTNIVQFLSEMLHTGVFSSVIYFEPYRCTVKYELLIHRLKMGKKIFRISSIFWLYAISWFILFICFLLLIFYIFNFSYPLKSSQNDLLWLCTVI